jgi:RNA recognition motif-containing protein
MQNRLYIGNLAGDVAASTLQDLFERHGFVMDVKLVTGEKAGQQSGFGFVTMATDDAARKAIGALNGANLHGLVIKVAEALSDAPDARTESGRKS